MKKRYRILLWLILALIIVSAGAVWLVRDWPRRAVESAIARALDGEADLARLEVRDSRTVVLHGLTLRRSRAYPWFESSEVDRLTVTGDIGDMLRNRFESIVLDGVAVTARETDEPTPLREQQAGVAVGRLVVADGGLTVRSGDRESRFSVKGEITGLGQGLGGEVRLRSERLDVVPLLSFIAGAEVVGGFSDDIPLDLRHPIDDVVIDVRFGRDGAAALLDAAASGGFHFREADREPLAFPGLSLRIDEAPDGAWRFAAEARSPDLVSLTLAGSMAADGGNLQADAVRLVTDEPARLLFAIGLVPEGITTRGRAELILERIGDAPMTCRVNASANDLLLPRNAGSAAAGRSWQLDSLCPLQLAYEGTLERESETGNWLTAGQAVLSSTSAGELRADGSLLFGGGRENQLEASWYWAGPDLPAVRRLGAEGFDLNLPKRYRIYGMPRVTGRVSGPPGQPAVSGTVEVSGAGFCVETGGEPSCSLELSQGRLTADFGYREGRGIGISGLSLDGKLHAGVLGPLPLSLSASGTIDSATLNGRFEELLVVIGNLARIEGEGRWDRGRNHRLTAAVRLDQVSLPDLRQALVPLTGDLWPGYELEAAVSGGFDAAYTAAGAWTVDGVMETGEAWFASEDGGRAVQGLAARWQVRGEAGPDGALHVEASTEAGGFQLLWGSLFGDFQELRPRIRLTAGLEGGEGPDGSWNAEAHLQPLTGVRLQASLSGAEGQGRDYSASLAVDDLAEAFQRGARLPLGGSLPLLERIDARGAIHGSAEGRFIGDRVTLQGRIRLDGLDLTGAEQTMAVRGLDLDLPLDLVLEPAGTDGVRQVGGSVQAGRMGFDELRLDTVVFQRTDSGLVVQGDTVSLEASQSIPLLGGTVTFHRLTMAGLLGVERRLETGLTLEGLQLSELSRALEWPPFEGELEGNLPRVLLSPTSLRVDGGGEISLFGGVVRISDISGEDVLSRYPRLTFSADFSEIDLARFTRTFDVGEVTGILEGRVSDCRLFAGTPVGFRAELRTVPREGVAQTINVKAINNIAIIGTGGRISVFDRGLHSLLDRYTYEQLGVKMRLEKDMFYLRGTERRGEKELFLKGRLPFRIDVVNAEPGKTVSFSTMLARLQALDFSRAVTETGGGAK